MLGTIFMNNLVRGDIDSVDLVSRLTFNVPVRLMRNYYPINLPILSNNYYKLYHLICSSTFIPVLKTALLALL